MKKQVLVLHHIALVKAILQIFGQASGLLVNYTKSSAALLHCAPDDATAVTNELGCPIVKLPMTYLGIPLTIRRPTCGQLQAMVKRVASQLPLEVWLDEQNKNKPAHPCEICPLCYPDPPAVGIRASQEDSSSSWRKSSVDSLWAGPASANGGNCHVNWRRVCRPIALGGLGVQDIERAGLALRLRWQWLSRTDTAHAWSGLELQFPADERVLFFASTHMVIGDGQTAKFWEERWIQGRSIREIAPQLYACVSKHRRKIRTIADGHQMHNWACDITDTIGVHEIRQYLQLWFRLSTRS